MSSSPPTFETLSIEPVDEHVTIVRLNRPDASNALNTQMGRDLVRYFEDAALDPKACAASSSPAPATRRSAPAATSRSATA